MDVFGILLGLAAWLCSLVAGLLLAFAIVVMPGIRSLDDQQFLRTFQVIDRIIQNNQPMFLLIWVGSAIATIGCGVFGVFRLQGLELLLLIVAVVAYILGVQVATIRVHLPLNNGLQALAIEKLNAAELLEARRAFEPRWNRSNSIRTTIACAVSGLLILLAAAH